MCGLTHAHVRTCPGPRTHFGRGAEAGVGALAVAADGQRLAVHEGDQDWLIAVAQAPSSARHSRPTATPSAGSWSRPWAAAGA